MTATEIVAAIEATLLAKGISKGEFYAACNVSAAQMSNWRRGKNYPLMDTMARINAFLGTDLVLTGNGANSGSGLRLPTVDSSRPSSGLRLPTIEKSPVPSGDEAEARINPRYYDLSPEARALVDSMIEQLAKGGQ